METTINNLYFKYDGESNRINIYNVITNNLICSIYIKPQKDMNRNYFDHICHRWALAPVYLEAPY